MKLLPQLNFKYYKTIENYVDFLPKTIFYSRHASSYVWSSFTLRLLARLPYDNFKKSLVILHKNYYYYSTKIILCQRYPKRTPMTIIEVFKLTLDLTVIINSDFYLLIRHTFFTQDLRENNFKLFAPTQNAYCNFFTYLI